MRGVASERIDNRRPGIRSRFRAGIARLLKRKPATVGLCIVITVISIALLAQLIAPYEYDEQHLSDSLLGPNTKYIFGTDLFGRDQLSRIVYGARISLLVGFVAASMGACAGIIVGIIAGYYSRIIDNVLMRLVDIILSFPPLMLAIAVAAMLGPGLLNASIAISMSQIGRFARIARSSVLSIKELEYIEAARVCSAGNFWIIRKHITPNILAPLIVQFSMNIAYSILAGSGLSFIGLGIQPPIPEWGAMLSEGRAYIGSHWWLTVFPGAAIMFTVYGFNLIGDGLRDTLDPRLRGTL